MFINLNKVPTQLQRAMYDNKKQRQKSLTKIIYNKNQTNKWNVK